MRKLLEILLAACNFLCFGVGVVVYFHPDGMNFHLSGIFIMAVTICSFFVLMDAALRELWRKP